jgi:hypothetical protein
MKKVLVVLAVVIGLALVFTSGYAQKWDSADEAQAIAKGKPFKFAGLEILSIDPKAQTVSIKNPNTGKTAIARLGYAKFEGSYSGVADLKVGEKVSGEGMVVNGTNWIQKIRLAEAGAKPAVGPNKSNN